MTPRMNPMIANIPSLPARSRLPRTLFSLGWAALVVAWTLVSPLPTRADVRLPALFTDHVVLQQGLPLRVWGWATPGEKVRVEFRKQSATVACPPSGRWSLTLKAERAGGPDLLVVQGNNHVEIQDVRVGEVWICSGQSNMQWPTKQSFQAEADIASATNEWIRLFSVPRVKAVQPLADVKAVWQRCAPEDVAGFSAVAYYFGRALQAARGVPVGLIHTSWGGSPAEVWMRDEVLKSNAEYQRDIVEAYPAVREQHAKAVAAWEQEKAEAARTGTKFEKARPREPWCPSELYNGMIAPLIPFGIRGAIWYQGESNAGRADQYRRLFPDMIRNWRHDWSQGPFTFLAVQLAPYDKVRKRTLEQITAQPVESDWSELREAQVLASQILPNVGLAIITDVGEKDDVHPTRKVPVGERLALAARVIAYRERIHGLSPEFKKAAFKKGRATLTFDRVGPGLEARGGELTGFAIAGPDRQFLWAKAQVQGKNKIVVWNETVPEPVAVRFGWADYPVVNLFSRGGLPVSPFRTDAFPLTTARKP